MEREKTVSSHNSIAASLSDYLKALPLYLLPQHFLSRLMYRLTRCPLRLWKEWQIRWFIQHYGVDMTEARESDQTRYEDFNQFFTRELREGVRPIAESPDALICPVDGAVSQVGSVDGGTMIQAKGRHYTLQALLANDDALADVFHGGSFINLYLSPRDYHRIHMPLSGKLTRMCYEPGRLFAVNPHTARVVPELFARNERVINLFETEAGPMALIMVGAIFVGGMETFWAGPITPRTSRREPQTWTYEGSAVVLQKGEEIGRFNMGSTVILLFGPNAVQWTGDLQTGTGVRMGEAIGMIFKRR